MCGVRNRSVCHRPPVDAHHQVSDLNLPTLRSLPAWQHARHLQVLPISRRSECNSNTAERSQLRRAPALGWHVPLNGRLKAALVVCTGHIRLLCRERGPSLFVGSCERGLRQWSRHAWHTWHALVELRSCLSWHALA